MQKRSPMRWLAALVVVLGAWFAPTAAQAQTGKISGVVTDAASGQPIEGVQVFVQGTGLGAISQANGRYFILSVQPGTYTLQARRIGYQSQEQVGVQITIDATREVNFRLNAATAQLGVQRITAQARPLVERGQTGSQTSFTAEQIQALPVTDITGVLALQQGFTVVPQSTQLMSLAEEERSTVSPIRVRGARAGSTISLVDGIPVNNPVFGSTAVSVNVLALSGGEFQRGYLEPQYGNALSGAINQAVREGGADVAGSIDYQTSALAGALGSRPDELLDKSLLRGYLGGPVPGTASRLRYMLSGQIESGASRVLEFDDVVASFERQQTFTTLPPQNLDREAGWRAFGGDQNQQFVAKLTFLPVSASRINLLAINQQRQRLPYDRRYLLSYIGDPLTSARGILDSLGLNGSRGYRDLIQGSVRDQSALYSLSWEQRFSRTSVQVRAAQTGLERSTCNVHLGVCVAAPFQNGNFSEQFSAPFNTPGIPFGGTSLAYGGEDYTTRMIRGDVQSQITDHHNLQGGVWFTRHDIEYSERRGIGGNSGPANTVNQLYRAKPNEFAMYLQDRIEYDFLTVRVGARYEYGKAAGRGFSNPLDPTNGTTAREVCEGTFAGTTPYSVVDTAGRTLRGAAACAYSPIVGQRSGLLDSATRIAQRDDFSEAEARTAFSPRIGLSFPLTERSQLFFNAGRYVKIPDYSLLYRNSGVGTTAGAGDDFCEEDAVKPGTNECVPPLVSGLPDFVGNVNLNLEEATQYEVGYGAEFGRGYAVNVAVYNRDETGLSGLRRSRATLDIGTTYNGALPRYTAAVNQDFLTSRGIEVQFRRSLRDNWSYDLNYGWSRTTTNSPPPDRSFEIENSGELDQTALREIVSEVDQPHRFNATLTYAVGRQVPTFRFANLLRDADASLTYTFFSGFPYTPRRAVTFGGVTTAINAADINPGRAPAIQQVNLNLRKRFAIANVQYGAFIRVDNLLDRKNCVQVFVTTGTCDSGLRDPLNRRVGNFDETTSTNTDQPEYVGSRRSLFSGLSISF